MADMRDRLIELQKSNCVPGKKCGMDCLECMADHLLANGVILPPMKLGQICFVFWVNDVEESRVSSLTQKADGSFKIRLTVLRNKSVFEITPDEIGRDVFLTREEAEKALREKEK